VDHDYILIHVVVTIVDFLKIATQSICDICTISGACQKRRHSGGVNMLMVGTLTTTVNIISGQYVSNGDCCTTDLRCSLELHCVL